MGYRDLEIRTTLRGHKKAVNWVLFAPDGTRLASASDDGSVRIWDVRSLEERRLGPCDNEAAAVVYLPDGQTVVVATRRGRIALIETQSGATRWAFDRPGLVKSLTVSPVGKEMAITFDSKPTERWDLTKTPPVALRELLPRDVVQYSPDGQTLVLGTDPGVLVFLPRNGPLRDAPSAQHLSSKFLDAIALAPDGRTLAVAGAQGVIQITDMNAQEERPPRVGHRSRIGSMTGCPRGRPSPRQATTAPLRFGAHGRRKSAKLRVRWPLGTFAQADAPMH